MGASRQSLSGVQFPVLEADWPSCILTRIVLCLLKRHSNWALCNHMGGGYSQLGEADGDRANGSPEASELYMITK